MEGLAEALNKGLVEVEAGEKLNYKKAITKENAKFSGDLKARQEEVVKKIMEDLKTKEGGTEQMTVKGGVKQKQTTKKVVNVVPPKVDLEKVGKEAEVLLKGLEKNLDGIKYVLENVYTGFLSFRQKSRLIFGIRYRVCGNQVTYSLVTKESFKNFSKSLQGSYQPGNWDVQFDLNGEGVSKFSPIIEASIAKLKKAEKPKTKVKK